VSELCKRFEAIAEECRFVKDGRKLINLQKLMDRAHDEGVTPNFTVEDWLYVRQHGYISAMACSVALKHVRTKTPALASS